ncbi:hypothetical protein [Deinococcus rufus]|uniref:Uncharacterized protein n=1 Tax=Deinococcus rufus TaxID=2136097 RepID=A0ABV7Z7W5_9DEIO
MDRQTLAQAVVDDLALTWLQVPGHAFSLSGFARARGLTSAEVERAVLGLAREGVVRVQYARSALTLTAVVLTHAAQERWIHDRSAALLPGSERQLLRVTTWLHRVGPVAEQDIVRKLGVLPSRAHQLVVMLRCLGRVQAAVGVGGRFEEVRCRPG